MLVLRFNHQRRRQPPKPQVLQDELPRVDVPPPGQSIREQIRHARAATTSGVVSEPPPPLLASEADDAAALIRPLNAGSLCPTAASAPSPPHWRRALRPTP